MSLMHLEKIRFHGTDQVNKAIIGGVVDPVAVGCSFYNIIAFITKEEYYGP